MSLDMRLHLNSTALRGKIFVTFKFYCVIFLILSSRWNSLHEMLETFIKLYDCVQQALIKIKMSHLLEPVNRDLMVELVEALEPIKVCVMEISRSDADLMSADIALEFMLDKLSEQKSEIATQLYEAIKIRVTQRRQKLMSSLLSHLINPEFKMSSKHGIFSASTQQEMSSFIEEQFTRLFPTEELPSDDSLSFEEGDTTEVNQRSMQSELRDRIAKKRDVTKVTDEIRDGWGRKHLLMHKKTRVLSDQLNLIKNALLSVKPTSIDCERVFSITGKIVSPLRCSLSDKSINSLTFLKYHFLRESNK